MVVWGESANDWALMCENTRHYNIADGNCPFPRAPRIVPCYNAERMNKSKFERTVGEAIDALPDYVKRHVHNVAIVVEEWPDDETLDSADVDSPEELLGFYSGIPLSERTSSYGLVPPDKITLYRGPIQSQSRNDAEVVDTVRQTLRHELAHYFGIDDERLDELGAY